MPVISGAAVYPQDVLERLAQQCRVVALDALSLAEEAGSAKAVNLVLLGVLKKLLGGDEASWQKAIAACVKEKFLAVNQRAFALGQNH